MIFDQLVALLDKPNDEVWGLIWSDDALAILERHHELLIPEILIAWKQWPMNRQEHLACILGEVGSEDERLLIIELMLAPDPAVRHRAEEALNEHVMTVDIAKRAVPTATGFKF
ncbi:hypothetical protein ASF11_19425 [Acidovorax sp. Leaf76]|nr:hypothetical protein ASF11_19425 [Acidovorax sp. Leaf76]KQO30351.1 hypothetical protein ASF19_15015 [Acidovorax sp. Leaf84]KQS28580.1 hypothetical protein ASG27_09535 [Acidovorax sp. Leaf191]